MDEAQARRLAQRFRRAIEDGTPLAHDIVFERFPAGSCGDTALLLGRFLREHGARDIRYVLGKRRQGDDWGSHAWLTVDGLIVDITADQFDEVDDPVIVAVASAWHACAWQIDRDALPGDYRRYDEQTVAHLDALYARLLDRIASTSVDGSGES
jgi:hypothetical protein